MTETEKNDLKEWSKQMVTIAIAESTKQLTECIYGRAIPDHERNCRHWFAIKVASAVLSIVITFLGIGNIWGFTSLLNAVNASRTSASAAASSAHQDATKATSQP